MTISASGHSSCTWSASVRAGRSWPSPTLAVRIRMRGGTPELDGAGRLRAPRLGAEDDVPPGRAYAEAGLLVLEVVPHVELVEPPSHLVLRPHVVEREVDHVVDEVAAVEPGREAP